jgi:hypothetical protein
MIKKVLKGGIGVLAGALLIAQFIQPERVNPPADPSASFEAVAAPSREGAARLAAHAGTATRIRRRGPGTAAYLRFHG